MPVSKNGRLYFTDPQYKAAQQCSALEYARRAGHDLVRNGNAYHLRDHDSMIFTQDGWWYWNSQKLRGRALEFIMHYEGRSLPEAVNILTENSGQTYTPSYRPSELPQEKKPFELPEKAPTFKRLFAYLCSTRRLDFEIVQELVHQHRIYESIRQYPSANGTSKEAHNVVFVAYDEQGQPRGAFQRGTNTNTAAFKRDVLGSDKKYAFCCPGRPTVHAVSVFEASIDAISHASLAKLTGEDWQDRDRIALGGISGAPLLHYLQTHPHICEIEFCLDSDAAGLAAVERLEMELELAGYTADNGYAIAFSYTPSGKDWNDHLVEFHRLMDQDQDPARRDFSPEAERSDETLEL